MKLLIVKEKDWEEHWLVDTSQSLFDTALVIVTRRLEQGYWYEDEDEQTAQKAVAERDGKLAWWLIQKRASYEYEGYDIVDLRSIGGIMHDQKRMLTPQLAYTRKHAEAIRLAAEANAVLDDDSRVQMAASMDLNFEEVQQLFEANEKEWEFIKDAVVDSGSPSGET